ncbi:MAG TPA: hypothetical protein PKD54_10315 [Pirellulaceae bacterium]|mgnify:CR=1 FL=1|nr:hypothetical protein [Pirellulaceae bacterium]
MIGAGKLHTISQVWQQVGILVSTLSVWICTLGIGVSQDIETIRIDMQRPDWIYEFEHPAADSSRVVVATAQCPTRVEARRALDTMIRDRIAEFIEFSLPDEPSAALWYDADYVHKQVIGANHKVVVQEPIDPELMEHVVELTPDMKLAYRGYARLELTEKLLLHIQQRLGEQQAWGRLKWWGVGYLGLVGCVGIVFCYLRLESMTRHHYSHRIQLLAAFFAVLLAVVIVRLLQF